MVDTKTSAKKLATQRRWQAEKRESEKAAGYKNLRVSISGELFEKLEAIQSENGLSTKAALIEFLAANYKTSQR